VLGRDDEKCPIDVTGRRKDEYMGSSVQPAPTSGLSFLYAPENSLTPPPPLDPQNKGDGSNGAGGAGGGAGGGGGGALSAPPSYNESFDHQTLQYGESF
jgi:hypothetical protein